jgi:hypothetical protein
MSVFHMHVDDVEQVHGSVLLLKPETDTLKPQRSALATSHFRSELGGSGGGVGGRAHAGVKLAGISKGAIYGMAWTERKAGRRESIAVGFFIAARGTFMLVTQMFSLVPCSMERRNKV